MTISGRFQSNLLQWCDHALMAAASLPSNLIEGLFRYMALAQTEKGEELATAKENLTKSLAVRPLRAQACRQQLKPVPCLSLPHTCG